MTAETETRTPRLDVVREKLHRASCIIPFVSERLLDDDQVLPGVTLQAATALVLEAMDELFPEDR